MILAKRLALLQKLKDWLMEKDVELDASVKSAYEANKWFTPQFVRHRIDTICQLYLDAEKLNAWIHHYHLDDNVAPKKVGIVMAGNIPLVGFHDFLSVFIAGHNTHLKLSEKDQVLFKKLIEKMIEFEPEVKERITIADRLKGCDAYIATGSNNSSRYFEYYFGRYPSVTRKNKTSVALLTGEEKQGDLEHLADDVFLYFGLGCRNVTQLYVPKGYDFVPLIQAFKKYEYLKDHTKYRNNYDYDLALLIMNNRQYMSNECIILTEGDHLFSPVSELYYSYYEDKDSLEAKIRKNEWIQCVVGDGHIDFGKSQEPGLFDYADGVDIMQFLLSI